MIDHDSDQLDSQFHSIQPEFKLKSSHISLFNDNDLAHFKSGSSQLDSELSNKEIPCKEETLEKNSEKEAE